MAEIKEALVPDIGDYSDVPVIEVLVSVGDTVSKDQSLVTLESDKATMEVPSSVSGVVKEIKVKLGDSLSQGALVALIEVADAGVDAGAAAAAKPAAAAAAPAAPAKAAPASAPAPAAKAEAAAPAASSNGGLTEARVPDIGDYTDIPVIEVLVAVGDTVAKDQSLVTLESDKATMEVPSSAAGVVKELKVKVGDLLSQGSVVAIIAASDGGAGAAQSSVKPPPTPPRRRARSSRSPCRPSRTSWPSAKLRRCRAPVPAQLRSPRRSASRRPATRAARR